jgi:competence protein ComEC
MPFPFLFLAISLCSGILLASQVSIPVSALAFLLLISFITAWLAFVLRHNRSSFSFILAATCFLGMTLYAYRDGEYEANALRRFDQAGYVDFSGRLYKSPSFGQGGTFLYLRVEKIRRFNREEKVKGNLRVSVLHPDRYPSPLKLLAGDRISVSAQILPVRDFRNFGQPRLANLRKNQNIHNHAVCKSPLLVEKQGDRRGFSVYALISSLRQKLQQSIEAHFSSPERTSLSQEGAVLEAMLLGERGRLDEVTTRALQKSGLFHLIAISGAHVAILSFLLFFILKLIRIPQRPSYLGLIFVLLFYAFLVEGRASVFRAAIMALAYLVGKLFWKNVNLINTISFSAFFLLLSNPFFLFDLGFELTFAATFSIILFLPRVLKHLPRLPLQISELFGLSLTAQMGILPFLVHSFNRVTFSALLLNLAAVPLTGLIMALGFLFLSLSSLSFFLGQLISQALAFLIRTFLFVSHLFDPLSFLSYRIPTPQLATVIGYFLFLFLLLLPAKIIRLKLAIFICFAICLIVLISYPFPASFSKTLKLTFLDVGQGDSMLVEFPGRKKMLIDGGGVPDSSFDIGEQVVSPFLWRKGIKTIDYLVLTHAHPDHLNGLKTVAANFRVINFWESFSPPQNPVYLELLASFKPAVRKTRVFRGFVQREAGVRIEALHPQENSPYIREASNEESLVLRICQGEVCFLLAADAESESELEIIRNFDDLRAQVLKSPHHGSRTSSSLAFLEKIQPEVVVISAGRGNVYGVPHPDVLERYERLGLHILRTDMDGAVEISVEDGNLAIRTARQESPSSLTAQ